MLTEIQYGGTNGNDPTTNGRGEAAVRLLQATKGLRRAIGNDIPVQQVMILVYLWLYGRSNQVDLARALDLLPPAASRHCRSLSSFYSQADGQPREKGQKLIHAERNKLKSNEMLYWLTDETQEIITIFMSDLVGA